LDCVPLTYDGSMREDVKFALRRVSRIPCITWNTSHSLQGPFLLSNSYGQLKAEYFSA